MKSSKWMTYVIMLLILLVFSSILRYATSPFIFPESERHKAYSDKGELLLQDPDSYYFYGEVKKSINEEKTPKGYSLILYGWHLLLHKLGISGSVMNSMVYFSFFLNLLVVSFIFILLNLISNNKHISFSLALLYILFSLNYSTLTSIDTQNIIIFFIIFIMINLYIFLKSQNSFSFIFLSFSFVGIASYLVVYNIPFLLYEHLFKLDGIMELKGINLAMSFFYLVPLALFCIFELRKNKSLISISITIFYFIFFVMSVFARRFTAFLDIFVIITLAILLVKVLKFEKFDDYFIYYFLTLLFVFSYIAFLPPQFVLIDNEGYNKLQVLSFEEDRIVLGDWGNGYLYKAVTGMEVKYFGTYNKKWMEDYLNGINSAGANRTGYFFKAAGGKGYYWINDNTEIFKGNETNMEKII